MLAVIATEIAVLAASSAPADVAASDAIGLALQNRGVAPIHEPIARACETVGVRTEAFAPLREFRRLVAAARKSDTNVDFDAAAAAIDQALASIKTPWLPSLEDEVGDAWLLKGIIEFHRGHIPEAKAAFASARSLGCDRRLSKLEVHPAIAEMYWNLEGDFDVCGHLVKPACAHDAKLSAAEICDLLWCDGVIVVGVSEQKGRASLVGTRYDAKARAFTERAVAANARDLIDAVMGSPAFAREQPSLVLPPEPPPPKVWQRTWFWTAVGGAAAALAGSLIYADATRDVHTNVNVCAGCFGGH